MTLRKRAAMSGALGLPSRIRQVPRENGTVWRQDSSSGIPMSSKR